MLRALLAPNPSPMTLDGTRAFVVGERRVAIIDPGPASASHLDALLAATADADACAILLTHTHPDHAEAAVALARRTGASVHAAAYGTLGEGETFETDAGALIALATPGHTPDHFAFHWPAAAAVFCGDLMMGGLDTALVAEPEGDLGDYLASLARIRALAPRAIHPAHGPSFDDPLSAIDGYVRHRAQREAQVMAALRDGAKNADEVVDRVYGESLDPALRAAAGSAVSAYLTHLRALGRIPGGTERPRGGRQGPE
jgi:glyoxylase-like metal-dependent hydrolase (beta-lactamase superfamily II)